MAQVGKSDFVRRFVVGALVVGSLWLVAPAGAEENIAQRNAQTQSAVATGGWLVKGGIRVKDESGTAFRFVAFLLHPGGEVDGTGPQRPGDPDLRRPWATLVQTSTDARGNNRTECVSFANPESAAYRNTRPGEVPSVFADVGCEDGRGYDFYRLEWKGTEPIDFGQMMAAAPFVSSMWFYSPYVYDRPHYSGGVEWNTFRYDGYSEAMFRVCGYRAGRVDCMVPAGQSDAWTPAVISGGWNTIRSQAGRLERTTCC